MAQSSMLICVHLRSLVRMYGPGISFVGSRLPAVRRGAGGMAKRFVMEVFGDGA